MNRDKVNRCDQNEEDNYQQASYLLARRQWNINYPLGVMTLFFAGAAALGVWWQYSVLNQTLSETRRDFVASQRAYVGIGDPRSGDVAEYYPATDPNKQGVLELFFFNAGASPATRMIINARTTVMPNPRTETHIERYWEYNPNSPSYGWVGPMTTSRITIPPHSTSSFPLPEDLTPTNAQFDQLTKNPPTNQIGGFTITGTFEYCDGFGYFRCESFATQYKPPPLKRLVNIGVNTLLDTSGWN